MDFSQEATKTAYVFSILQGIVNWYLSWYVLLRITPYHKMAIFYVPEEKAF